MSSANNNPPSESSLDNSAWLEIVRKQVTSLRHGAVEIIIHEGRVVEVKKSERVRLPSSTSPSSTGSTPQK